MAGTIQADTITNSAGNGPPNFPYGSVGVGNYFFGYMPHGTSWSTSSASYADPTISSGSNTLTTVRSSGLVVAAAASNFPGVTFTPNKVGAVYLINVSSGLASNTDNIQIGLVLTDGTNIINYTSFAMPVASNFNSAIEMNGIYVSTGTALVTVKVQLGASGGASAILGFPAAGGINSPSIGFSICQVV